MATMENYRLTGLAVRSLMRTHGVTIRALARQYKVTLKRVREVRAVGVRGLAAIEWRYMITGVWIDLENQDDGSNA
jgi:hypothetical protein